MPPRFLSAVCAAGLLALLISPTHAHAELRAPTVKFDLADGATVSDTVTVVAHAASDDDTGIDKVEFSVDGELEFTDTSTPYSFDWDTLAGTEGSHTLSATAYDAKGRTALAKITVTVDNELGKGADFHADAALAALKTGDTDTAIRYAHRALKIAPTNLRAARALAGIHRRKGEFDKAVALLEKAEIPDNDFEARADLVGLYIARGDAADSTEAFLKDASLAMEVYRKLQEARIAAVQGSDADAAMQRGDLYFSLRDWNRAIREYQKAGGIEEASARDVNRLILTYLYAGRARDAETAVRIITNAKRADDVTHALAGLLLYDNRQFTHSDETVQAGVDSGVLPSLLVAAYADMSRKATKKARAHVEQILGIAPDLPEASILNAYLLPDPIDAHKALIAALEKNPLLVEGYAARGFQILLGRDKGRFQAADQIFEFALKADPNNSYVLLGRALSLMAEKRANEAEPILNQLLQQEPNGPDVHMAAALNLSLLDKTTHITMHMDAARKLDPDLWADVFVPKPADLIARVYRYRFSPVVTPAALYPKKAE